MQQCGWGSWSRPYLRLRAKDDRSSRGLSAAGDRFPPPRRRVLGGLAPYMFPRVFGDEFGDEFGDSLNLVINLVTNSVMNFVNH